MNYGKLRVKLQAIDNKWITMKGSEEGKGRRVLLDDQGNIIGGDVPKFVQGKSIKNAFGKGSTSTSPTPVKAKGNNHSQNEHFTRQEYVKESKTNNIVESMERKLGVSNNEAKNMLEAIEEYTLSSYTSIRDAEQYGGDPEGEEYSKNLSEFIDKSPKWNAPAYRGIQVSQGMVDKLLTSKGQIIDMGGTSSWSSEKRIAELFSVPKSGKKGVLFEVEKPGRATSIAHLSHMPDEGEVLVHKNQKYKIMDAKMHPNGNLVVTLKGS